jgi:hypothetical protein
MRLDTLGPEVGRQRNRTVPSPGEGSERFGDGAGQGTPKMRRAFRLGALDLAQEPERCAFRAFTFKDLRMRQIDGLLLLRETLCPDVACNQMQLPPGVVQIVRAPIQLLMQTLDGGFRGGQIEPWDCWWPDAVVARDPVG